MVLDQTLLQRLRLEIYSWPRGREISEVTLIGEHPDRLWLHLYFLLKRQEIAGVAFKAKGERVVLVKRLTPKGYRAMLETAARTKAERKSLTACLQRLGVRGLIKVRDMSWRTASAVLIAAVLAWLGLSS